MQESTAVVVVILGILLTIVSMVIIGANNQNVKVRSGLQECVTKTPAGNTLVVWQKECK